MLPPYFLVINIKKYSAFFSKIRNSLAAVWIASLAKIKTAYLVVNSLIWLGGGNRTCGQGLNNNPDSIFWYKRF